MTTIDDNYAALPAGPEPYLNAVLHPYRSMGRRGFFWLIVIFGALMLAVSIPFFLIGAWPIVGFAGLDLLLIYWAFRRNFTDARATEHILITHDTLVLTQISAKGKEQKFCFNPYWVRLETQYEEDKGMTKLALTSHGQTQEVGAFLHASERESLSEALVKALQSAKSTQNSNAQVSGG